MSSMNLGIGKAKLDFELMSRALVAAMRGGCDVQFGLSLRKKRALKKWTGSDEWFESHVQDVLTESFGLTGVEDCKVVDVQEIV